MIFTATATASPALFSDDIIHCLVSTTNASEASEQLCILEIGYLDCGVAEEFDIFFRFADSVSWDLIRSIAVEFFFSIILVGCLGCGVAEEFDLVFRFADILSREFDQIDRCGVLFDQ